MPIDPSISPHDALRVEVLSEALPFIQRFSGRRVVIKYGGAAMVDEHLREAVFRDIALLASVGVRPVVVHGGGPEINQWLKRLAIEAVFQEGFLTEWGIFFHRFCHETISTWSARGRKARHR